MSEKAVIRGGAIAIENKEIIDIGKTNELKRKYSRYEKINAEGKVILPGFINTHQHAAMSLLRGYADDYPLGEWLEKWIWPVEKHMTGKDIYVGALLTALESLMSGITTVNTMYHYMDDWNEAKAFVEAGIRGVIGHVCFSWRKEEDLKALRNLVGKWHNAAEGRIRATVDPHAPYTVDPEYMKELREITRELNEKYASQENPIIWHIHLAETEDEAKKVEKAFGVKIKSGVVKYLDDLGVLGEDVIAAHCVYLTNEDIKSLAKNDVKVSHNPISNLKLGSGVSPVQKLIENKITVSLGTDSPCSNNTADLFNVMKIAAILHKGINKNPTLLPAEKIIRMATIEGAKALHWEREIGSIEIGKKADIIIVNLRKPHLTPIHNEISHIVYAAKPHDVDTVIVDGKIIMENRKVETLNVEKVMDMAEKTKNELLSRSREK